MGSGAKKRRNVGAKVRRRLAKGLSAGPVAAAPGPTTGSGTEPAPDPGPVPERPAEGPAHTGSDPPEARRFEAFGRVMAALATEAEFMRTSRDLTWWQGTERDWNIEWREGPYASDVAAMLAARIPGPVGAAGRTDRSSAAVTVLGVPFTLRAIDPLGRERATGRAGLWRLAAALNTSYPDSPRQSLARRHWEELLGG